MSHARALKGTPSLILHWAPRSGSLGSNPTTLSSRTLPLLMGVAARGQGGIFYWMQGSLWACV